MPFDPEPAVSSHHAIDLHVGGRVRMRRKFMGMSQEALATAIDLTFQQVQKYERASNRISASKLYEIGKALKVPVSYFFEGLDGAPTEVGISANESDVNAFLRTTDGISLAQAFPGIPAAKTRRKLLELIEALSDHDPE